MTKCMNAKNVKHVKNVKHYNNVKTARVIKHDKYCKNNTATALLMRGHEILASQKIFSQHGALDL